MRGFLLTLVAVLATYSGFAQGTILFYNWSSTAGDIRVCADPSGTIGAGVLGTVNRAIRSSDKTGLVWAVQSVFGEARRCKPGDW